MRSRLGALLVLLIGVLLAGCTGSADDENDAQPTVSEQLQELEPAEPVELSPDPRVTCELAREAVNDHADFGGAAQGFSRTQSDPGYVAVMVSSKRDRGRSGPATVEETETAVTILDSIVDERFREAS